MYLCDPFNGSYVTLKSSYNNNNIQGVKGCLRAVVISDNAHVVTVAIVSGNGDEGLGPTKKGSRDITLDGCFGGVGKDGGVTIELFKLPTTLPRKPTELNSSSHPTSNVINAIYESLAWLNDESYLGVRGLVDRAYVAAMDEFNNSDDPADGEREGVKTLKNVESEP